MKPLFHSTIVRIGGMVNDFLQEETLILFNQDVPAELHEMAILHTKSECADPVRPGDYLLIRDKRLLITSVGEKANETLQSIGHCTVKMDGSDVPQLPGMIHVERDVLPPLEIGNVIAFVRS